MLRYADHRAHLDTIIRAALKAADPAEAVRRHWPEVDLGDAERVFIVGAGKAGAAMAAAAAELLGPRLARGVVAIPSSPPTSRLAPQTSHASRLMHHDLPQSSSLNQKICISYWLSSLANGLRFLFRLKKLVPILNPAMTFSNAFSRSLLLPKMLLSFRRFVT